MRQLRGVALAMAVAIAGGLQFGISGPAFAQSAIEEITVTAQKREENVSDVPVAVSVLGRTQIESSFSSNLEELQALVPSVSFRTGNTTRNSALTIRGVGTISFSIGAEPSVSTVVDNVVLGRSGQAFGDLYDLERVEVLRGPQGTLFGKNASAGVVNITTRRPGEELEGYVSGTFYEDNEYQLRGRVSGPLTDSLRGSLTVLDSQFDGYIENVFNNQTINGYDRQGIRAMFEYDISDATEVLLIYEDYEADNDCCVDLEARLSGRNDASEAAPSGNGLDLDQRRADHDFETRTLDSSTAFSVQIESAVGDHTLGAEVDQLGHRAAEGGGVLDRHDQHAVRGQEAALARAVAAVGRAVAGQLAKDVHHLGVEAGDLLVDQAPGLGRLGAAGGQHHAGHHGRCNEFLHGATPRTAECHSPRD